MCFGIKRQILENGKLNQAKDWMLWQDGLLFREEQRAIGHAMICESGQGRSIMDYASFCPLVDIASGSVQSPWIEITLHFLCERHPDTHDFREIRFKRLVVHLVDLIDLLDKKRVSEQMREQHQKYREELQKKYQQDMR